MCICMRYWLSFLLVGMLGMLVGLDFGFYKGVRGIFYARAIAVLQIAETRA